MRWQWTASLAAAFFCWAATAHAGDNNSFFPSMTNQGGPFIVQAPAPEPIAAPKAPGVPSQPTVSMPAGCTADNCCAEEGCTRHGHHKERFNLCDYWQILCAMFYCK